MQRLGSVIEPDFHQLSASVTELIENFNLRKRMGANAYRLARTSFSMDVIAKRLVVSYEKALAEVA